MTQEPWNTDQIVGAIHELPQSHAPVAPSAPSPRARRRRPLRLRSYDYSAPGAYFVTIVTRQRIPLFGDVAAGTMQLNAAGRIVLSLWDRLPAHYPSVELDEFVVMPNHVHGIIVIGDEGAIRELPLQHADGALQLSRRRMLLPRVIGRFKMTSARSINRLRGEDGSAVWQRNYYEHVIRTETEFDRIRMYIRGNPARWAIDRENPAVIPPEPRIAKSS